MPGMAHGSLQKRCPALSVSRCECPVVTGVPDVAVAGAARVSIFPEVSSKERREKQIAGVWRGGEHRSLVGLWRQGWSAAWGWERQWGLSERTPGWVSRDKHGLLSANYNLFDLTQATTKVSSKKKKIITDLTMKSFQGSKSTYREQGWLFSWNR